MGTFNTKAQDTSPQPPLLFSRINRSIQFFQAAQRYEEEAWNHSTHHVLAFDNYLQAARLGHRGAMAPLVRLGEEVDEQRQQALSQLYRSMHDEMHATYWATQAMKVQFSSHQRA